MAHTCNLSIQGAKIWLEGSLGIEDLLTSLKYWKTFPVARQDRTDRQSKTEGKAKNESRADLILFLILQIY